MQHRRVETPTSVSFFTWCKYELYQLLFLYEKSQARLQAGKKSNLQLDKREKTVQITEPENPDNAPGAFLVSAVNQEEDGISLVIPDKTAIAKNVGNKHIKSKAGKVGSNLSWQKNLLGRQS